MKFRESSGKPDRRRRFHACSANGEWSYCTGCHGRIHLPDCTSRKDPKKDCCEKRHKDLFDKGQTRGLDDSSLIMWHPDYPMGIHEPALKKLTERL